jgi:hypothetical protein
MEERGGNTSDVEVPTLKICCFNVQVDLLLFLLGHHLLSLLYS